MDIGLDLSHSPPYRGTIRSFNGCWTCRLRRKKCDERHPVCDTCAALHITCHYGQDKPEWMDGGVRQEEMAERLKREVKETAHRRRGERAVHDRVSAHRSDDIATPNSGLEPPPRPQRGADCTLTSKDIRETIPFGRSDTVLLMFYLEHVFPFLFPFYRPPTLQGGRAWVLEMMIGSPVVRQATLCQSSYFFSLTQRLSNCDVLWETVLMQTRNAFGVLRQALQVIDSSGITEHLHGAVRIMASIMQVQRFDITISSFTNCQAHLNAALALFRQLFEIPGVIELEEPLLRFNTILDHLGPTAWVLPTQCIQVPSAEQAAFRFSSTLLILDDIIASTVLQEQPRLYEYHRSLLGNIEDVEPPINLEAATGCQNWALLQVGEISALDAWKQQCKRDESLDVMELVRRAAAIKNLLEAQLVRLETEPAAIHEGVTDPMDAFMAGFTQQSKTLASLSPIVTRVWAHAALAYLFIVVSGWQPASADLRYHVSQIIELLTHQISPPGLLRTMVWPFCVAGCLAEPAQEAHLREMVEALQPPSIFGTVRKALEIMEHVWRNRDVGDVAGRDLATCFRSQGDLVLLV
ncbi:fungal-specific transcription factor domain-containing protein [Hypoxylon rubiginosum]|uniref:Fungal-specific transcription factor domain-containing protein n=1 Tax=Hypoxylon rubiginosum TaxID=110542 RepID=A0ACC0CMT5_9PEZI|nr:fungal-specific transcription factor domain-containing protein [Hypoxylon rubiginosum]